VSRKPPRVPKLAGPSRTVPFERRIETLMPQQSDVPMVTPLTSRLTRWPATPPNDTRAFCPGTVVAAVTGAPPGTIVPVLSGGTSKRVREADPVALPCGSRTTV
jgi:hypothetical protein